MSFLSLLTVLLIGLKLAGVITWSWWIVLLGIYAVPALIIALFLVALICGKKIVIKYKGKRT